MQYNNLKTLGPKAARLITTLHERNKTLFRLEDVQEILSLNEALSRDFSSKLVKRGLASRLKPGLFILVPFEMGKEREYVGNPYVVAREIVEGKNYYLSHGTAMAIHGITTQPQLVIYVSTLKPRRPITIVGTEFRFIHIKRELFFGMEDYWVTNQETVRVSTIERTVIDGLRKPAYCGGLIEVAKGLWIRQQEINVNRLIEHAIRLGEGSVMQRLGYLLELYRIGGDEHCDILKHHITKSHSLLDPLLPREGKYLHEWRLQLNITPDELRSAVSI